MTAAELMAKLHADPEWVAANKAREQKRKELDRMLAENEQPIVEELSQAGFQVKSVYDLVNTDDSYPEAIPILLSHLRQGEAYDSRIREGIARALTVKEAESAIGELFEAFRRDSHCSLNGAKAALGNAIYLLAKPHHIEKVVELALDHDHGPARWALVEWLGKWKNKSAMSALRQLTLDPEEDVAATARRLLGEDD